MFTFFSSLLPHNLRDLTHGILNTENFYFSKNFIQFSQYFESQKVFISQKFIS